MKDDIINVLKNSDKALTIYELQDALNLKEVKEVKELGDALRELEDEVIIYHTNKDRYMMLEDSQVRKGIMRANKKGFGFVEIEDMEEDVYVSQDNMNGALHDDEVLVEITSKMTLDRLEGRVLKVIKKRENRYIGEINFKDDVGYITLDDNKLKLEIKVPKEDSMNAVDGHKVVVELGKKINNSSYYGKVIDIIGHKNDPGVDILSIVYKYNINTEFPDDVKEELKTIPSEVKERNCW